MTGWSPSLWFVHLPSYVEACDNRRAAMDEAFQIMAVMQKILSRSVDEVGVSNMVSIQ